MFISWSFTNNYEPGFYTVDIPPASPATRQQCERLTHTAGWSSAFKDTVTKMRGTFDLRCEPRFTYSALVKPRTLWACECVLAYFQVHFLNAMRKISWEGGPGFTSVLSQEEKGNTMNFSWVVSPSVQWDIFCLSRSSFWPHMGREWANSCQHCDDCNQRFSC